MKLKVTFNNETHKISKLPEDFQSLVQLISKIFLANLPENWGLEYIDADGDKITLADKQDYKELIGSEEDGSNKNSVVKLFIMPREGTNKSHIKPRQEVKESSPNNFDGSFQVIEPTREAEIKSVNNLEENLREEELIVTKPNAEVDKKAEQSRPSAQQTQEASINVDLKSESVKNKKVTPKRLTKKSKSLPRSFKPQPATTESQVNIVIQKPTEKQDLNKAFINEISKIATITLKELKESAKKPTNKPQKRAQPLKQAKEKPVHSDIGCDGCQTYPLFGIRYKCSVCPDFDFCEKCERTRTHFHAFIKIKYPGHVYLHEPCPFMTSQPNPMSCPFLQFSHRPQHNMPPQHIINYGFDPKNLGMDKDKENIKKMDGPCAQRAESAQEKPLKEIKQLKKVPLDRISEVIIQDETSDNVLMKDLHTMNKKSMAQMSKNEEGEVKREDTKKLSKVNKKFSDEIKNKAKQLKDLFPGIKMNRLLSFVESAPQDLDLVELIENFRY